MLRGVAAVLSVDFSGTLVHSIAANMIAFVSVYPISCFCPH